MFHEVQWTVQSYDLLIQLNTYKYIFNSMQYIFNIFTFKPHQPHSSHLHISSHLSTFVVPSDGEIGIILYIWTHTWTYLHIGWSSMLWNTLIVSLGTMHRIFLHVSVSTNPGLLCDRWALYHWATDADGIYEPWGLKFHSSTGKFMLFNSGFSELSSKTYASKSGR